MSQIRIDDGNSTAYLTGNTGSAEKLIAVMR
jgi:hypothetical protein